MAEPKEFFKETGIINDKQPNEKGGPKGFFYLEDNKNKFTCWSQTIFDAFETGDEVTITYYITENNYKGKVYQNYTVSRIEFKNKGEVRFTKEEMNDLEQFGDTVGKLQLPKVRIKSENGVVKLAGIAYRIKDIELELLKVNEGDLKEFNDTESESE